MQRPELLCSQHKSNPYSLHGIQKFITRSPPHRHKVYQLLSHIHIPNPGFVRQVSLCPQESTCISSVGRSNHGFCGMVVLNNASPFPAFHAFPIAATAVFHFFSQYRCGGHDRPSKFISCFASCAAMKFSYCERCGRREGRAQRGRKKGLSSQFYVIPHCLQSPYPSSMNAIHSLILSLQGYLC